MTKQQRRFEDDEFELRGAGRREGASVGTLFFATAIGLGLGLLAAPQPGTKTRKRLRKRLASLGADLEEGFEDVQEFGGRARERVRDRVARLRKRRQEAAEELERRLEGEDEDEEEESEDSGAMGAILAVAAGVAATYLLTSERAEPARSKVMETAATVRQQAEDRWDRFQHRKGSNGDTDPTSGGEGRSETRRGSASSDQPPEAS
ncbi:MAG: YtxH domain-containing protein [Gemmatimonadales bacterium]|nr:YtxH domain-containing protein [Gemmatimonadales bacterium]